MVPGEYILRADPIELNAGRPTIKLFVANSADRPVQVGSHYHFYEINPALQFDRARAYGMRLNIPAGTAVRFEPGAEREVELVPYEGQRVVLGFRGAVMGALADHVDGVSPADCGAGTAEEAGQDLDSSAGGVECLK